MLIDISIRDLALFESAELEYERGFNVLTGQTGAGKSLSLRALELLLGQRPKTSMVRVGADHARVDGRFCFAPSDVPARLLEVLREGAPSILEDWDEQEELELVLTRRLSGTGRTRAHLNHRPVTQRFLRELAGMLVEIHGQNDHQRLLEPGEQRALLDSFGGLTRELATYRKARRTWVELAQRCLAFAENEADSLARLDLLRFQARELADAAISVDEVDAMRRERDRLRHGEELLFQLGGLLGSLEDEEGSALDRLHGSESVLERWLGRIDELEGPTSELREATEHLAESVHQLRAFLDDVEHSPTRLEEVEERLAEVERLERKYRCDVSGLVARLPEFERELQELEDASTSLETCSDERDAAHRELQKIAAKLTRARKALCTRLEKEVHRGLKDLGLEGARFSVQVEPRTADALDSPNADMDKTLFEAELRRFAPEGADSVEFLLAANPGEGAAPLRKVASGGEAARVMLALRGALAAKQTIPTLVFDEVDAGVGGRLAPKVGQHLRQLGEHYQILCITHLPAVAALAHTHLEVEKHVEKGRTTTLVRRLVGDDRVAVIADMIAGGKGEETARKEAARLLAVAD